MPLNEGIQQGQGLVASAWQLQVVSIEVIPNGLDRNIKKPMKMAIWKFGRAETWANAVKGLSLL